MQLSDEAPKLPKLPFLLGDGMLLATAWYIARQSDGPLGSGPMLAIVSCVAAGAVLAVIPFLAEYARKQEESLQERQNALEALARTTAAAAEQISIAASGLHTIAELAQKNLKAAEQFAPKLQEKINDFVRRADEALVAENEALTQEVNTLRASDAEKLEAASDKIRVSAAELTKLEAATHKHLATVSETLARLPALAEEAIRAQTATLRVSAEAVLAEIDARLTSSAGHLAPTTREALPAASLAPASVEAIPAEPATESKRKRTKAAPDEAVAAEPASPAETVASIAPAEVAADVSPLAAPPPAAEPAAPPVETELPVPVEAASIPASGATPPPEPAAPLTEEPEDPKPARKAKRPTTSAPPFIPGLLNSDAPIATPGGNFSTFAPDEDPPPDLRGPAVDRAISADGLTRLLATAYIGIGNKLFLRGDGPGLSWDQGVPLQFVSIGKWRWETADATASFHAKLYKNDQVECASLGSLTLDPGQQTEVTAAF